MLQKSLQFYLMNNLLKLVHMDSNLYLILSLHELKNLIIISNFIKDQKFLFIYLPNKILIYYHLDLYLFKYNQIYELLLFLYVVLVI